MLPHPETFCRINDLAREERLRFAAQQRLAASAQLGPPIRQRDDRLAGLVAGCWLRNGVTRLGRAMRGRLSPVSA
jgi:hypothetical protein